MFLARPQQVMPKDYWQPEDLGHIEETEGFPLPPVDAEGKYLDYVWLPSTSLRALSAACKRMSNTLVGGEVRSELCKPDLCQNNVNVINLNLYVP